MTWFLNNNNPGAAEAAMQFANEHEGLSRVHFLFGDEDRAIAVKGIDDERIALAARGMAAYQKSEVFCDVVRIARIVPNKEIIAERLAPKPVYF